jgi:hypothetical protein
MPGVKTKPKNGQDSSKLTTYHVLDRYMVEVYCNKYYFSKWVKDGFHTWDEVLHFL